MKRYLYRFKMHLILFCLFVTGCVFASENPVQLTVETNAMPSATAYTVTTAPVETLLPTRIFTPTPDQIVLPAVTMAPQEAEIALLELLKTNGNCTGKCIAGIQPDTMTVREAVDKMAQWGMVEIYENPRNGKTFVNLVHNPLNDRVNVDLSVGTWTIKMVTVDNVFFQIAGPPGDLFLGEDVWLANRVAWQGFRLDNILKAYGIPSYVGYFFQTTVEVGVPFEGRTIAYNMEIQYEQTNLVVLIGAMAFYDGDTLFLCPSKDPHALGIEINPERPLKEQQEFSPVTWQSLTGTDIQTFYTMFTDDDNLDSCIETNLQEIESLQPTFR